MDIGKKEIDLSKIDHKTPTIYEALGIKEEEFKKCLGERWGALDFAQLVKLCNEFEFYDRPQHSPMLMKAIYGEDEEDKMRFVLTYRVCEFFKHAERIWGLKVQISLNDFVDVVLSLRWIKIKREFEDRLRSPENLLLI